MSISGKIFSLIPVIAVLLIFFASCAKNETGSEDIQTVTNDSAASETKQ